MRSIVNNLGSIKNNSGKTYFPQLFWTLSILRSVLAEDRTIRTHVTNLRHKLKEAGLKEDCIETVYGMGYCLRGESNSR